jgi:signal transduction histidine kinase
MSANDRASVFRLTLLASVLWTLIVATSFYWNHAHEHQIALDLARSEASANIAKDLSFRLWATGHGGVFVPETDATPANPYLRVPDQRATTDQGQQLILMNPAYMVRQIQKTYSDIFGVKGHITSLNPLNPGNAPDAWEADALRGFENGKGSEAAAIADIDGVPHMRVMQAMKVEPGCMKCHAHQGYQVGDLRGGISASVPLGPYLEREGDVNRILALSHGGIGLIGLGVIFAFNYRARQRLEERETAERAIHELNASLDERVRQRTAELERANRELESFSYSISHDLRAPLRALNGYARILHDDEGATLTAEGREMLQRIWANADRMGLLIDDMLQFSRLGRAEMRRDDVNMQQLAEAVTGELRDTYPNTHIAVGPLPRVIGDETMLRQIWVNLIGNALKFSSKSPQPEISISGEISGNEALFQIRDNGVGFDMEHTRHLFEVFQRLHSPAEFPGTGAGLAIVKRVVERHGGRVWADAQPGAGATFGFALPVAG